MIQLELWQSGSGRWHVSYLKNLGRGWGSYLLVARTLGYSPAKYIEMVMEYKPDKVNYSKDFLFFSFSWSNEKDAAKFKNEINKKLKGCPVKFC